MIMPFVCVLLAFGIGAANPLSILGAHGKPYAAGEVASELLEVAALRAKGASDARRGANGAGQPSYLEVN